MAQRGMDKRIAGIIRWLERFQSSWRSGALESALMDAECARADLENLRLDVWSRVKSARVPRRVRGSAMVCLSLSTLLFVLATAVPLSRMADVPAGQLNLKNLRSPENLESLENLTASSPQLPSSSTLTSPPAVRKAQPSVSVRRPLERPKAAKAEKEKEKEKEKTEASGQTKKANEKTVPYDRVFSLLQTGARALRNDGSVIKIEKIKAAETDRRAAAVKKEESES